MNIMAEFLGRKAYNIHLKGNALLEKKLFKEAEAKHAEALAAYEKAVAAGDQNPRHMMAYGVLLMRTRQYEKAKAAMLKVEKMPGLGQDIKRQLRLNYAVCVWKMGQLDRAIELMKQTSAGSENSMIFGSLGYMLIEKARETGDFTEAVEFNQKAYEYDEDDAVVLDNMGQLNLAMGKREEALGFFERAHERKPTQVDTLYYLAKLYAEDGETAAATKMLERALSQTYSALCTTTREQAQALLDEIKSK
jgi:tetratricopeptide (TPR) repeat protein